MTTKLEAAKGEQALIENTVATIVITAQSFNPSIFTETWLDRNNVLKADRVDGMRVFSPEVAQFQTKEAQVIIIPSKMQIAFGIHELKESPVDPFQISCRIITLLPHTPYQALGLNFDFFVTSPAGQDFLVYDKDLLGTGEYKLIQEFSTADARFGRYFSKDYHDFRLKLDIKPVKAGPDKKDMLQFSFNFHYDIIDIGSLEGSQKLIDLIGTWDKLKDYSANLVNIGTKL